VRSGPSRPSNIPKIENGNEKGNPTGVKTMQILGFKTKFDFERHIQQDLASRPFGQPFQHELLVTLFLEHDWSKESIRLLAEQRALGKPIWFCMVEAVEDEYIQKSEWPHVLVHYPQVFPTEPDKCWMLRSWRECVRKKTVKMFEAKIKSDMRTWCRTQLEEHRLKFPVCEEENCGCLADHAYHVNPPFDENADTVIRRARLRCNDPSIPMSWFTESRHFGCDYPQGFKVDFLAECARARVRSLCSGCSFKPGIFYWPTRIKQAWAKEQADDEEMAALFRRARERNSRSRAERQVQDTKTAPPHRRTSADSERATGDGKDESTR
jgi:hypothetical protein